MAVEWGLDLELRFGSLMTVAGLSKGIMEGTADADLILMVQSMAQMTTRLTRKAQMMEQMKAGLIWME